MVSPHASQLLTSLESLVNPSRQPSHVRRRSSAERKDDRKFPRLSSTLFRIDMLAMKPTARTYRWRKTGRRSVLIGDLPRSTGLSDYPGLPGLPGIICTLRSIWRGKVAF
eukprot:1349247-Amorphochlora_amoeboformis.AAC.2